MKLISIIILTALLFTASVSMAQRNGTTVLSNELRNTQKQFALDPNSPLISRIATTPDDIIKRFRDAGMSPTEHILTKNEKESIALAIASLPPLHKRVLKQHLKSISFLDNMPNTALTSPVTNGNGVNLYHITFRAGILHQTISEWVTEKEQTLFVKGDSAVKVSIQAGLLSALTYVLLHEGTHVVDGSLHLISADSIAGKPRQNAFTTNFSNGVWKDINTLAWPFTDTIVVKSRFRPGGRPFKSDEATRVYSGLSQTPFVSLYSTASWHEDLAELLTVYHLNQILKQPFRLVIAKNGREVFNYEPMKSAVVKRRIKLLNYFYKKV
jgi:hypothetical protein